MWERLTPTAFLGEAVRKFTVLLICLAACLSACSTEAGGIAVPPSGPIDVTETCSADTDVVSVAAFDGKMATYGSSTLTVRVESADGVQQSVAVDFSGSDLVVQEVILYATQGPYPSEQPQTIPVVTDYQRVTAGQPVTFEAGSNLRLQEDSPDSDIYTVIIRFCVTPPARG